MKTFIEWSRSSFLRSRYVLILWLLGTSALATPQQTGDLIVLQATNAVIPKTLFGLNIIAQNRWAKWPSVPFGTWRSFHFTWSDVQPSPSHWNFAQTDFEVNASEIHHVELLPVIEGVPEWADSPSDPALAQQNPRLQARQRSLPADKKLYAAYVRAVATRYKGHIHAYELWNEPLGVSNFAKNIARVIELNEIAYRTLKEIDPTITVVSSAYSSGDPNRDRSMRQLADFAAAGGFRNCDAIAFHYYVSPARGQSDAVPPEQILAVIAQVTKILASRGIHKPIWSTEWGWPNLNDDRNPVAPPKGMGAVLPPQRAAAWLARSYLLGWTSGIQRIYWYAWRHDYFGLTQEDGSPKAPSVAYATVYSWLVGSHLSKCQEDVAKGIWICDLKNSEGEDQKLLWVESGRQTFRIPKHWHITRVQQIDGLQIRPASDLTLKESPILVEGTWR